MSNKLTLNEIAFFNKYGYLVRRNVFGSDEINVMKREADRVLELLINSSLANKRSSRRLDFRRLPSGDQVIRKVQPINDISLKLAQLSIDRRLVEPLTTLMEGEQPELMEEKMSFKQHLAVPIDGMEAVEGQDEFLIHTDWAYHREQGYPPDIISAGVCIDDCSKDSGPLHVWPGSHTRTLPHRSLEVAGKTSYVIPRELLGDSEGIDLEESSGSVIFFHCLLAHNSQPNCTNAPRRLMIFSYVPESGSVGADARNGPLRLQESPYEWQYYWFKSEGSYTDKFKIL